VRERLFRFGVFDFLFKEINPNEELLIERALACLKKEIELLMSNEAGKAKLVLNTQAETGEKFLFFLWSSEQEKKMNLSVAGWKRNVLHVLNKIKSTFLDCEGNLQLKMGALKDL
jgi:hypothetical protein